MTYTTENIRTVALVGHGGAGKTTLAEALLAKAGAIQAAGSVERGTTVCDFDPLEKSYQHSLNASASCISICRDVRVHLVDTPGLPDFVGQRDRRARRRRDRGGRRQRAERHRDDHRAHDAVGRRSASSAA